jgi:6-phosphogluconolactonase
MADQLNILDTPEALAERVAVDFAALVTETLASQEKFSVALAGGQTPKQFYARLAKEPYKSSIPWSRLWFFWGDERCVPKEHIDSNFRMAAEALLQFVPVPSSHVMRMRGEDPPPQAAQDYEKALRSFFRDAGLWPRFDLILLGLGPDGHTASLIPGSPAVSNHVTEQIEERRIQDTSSGMPQPRWVVHNVVRALQTVRLTFTYPVINQASHIWFLVTGAKKADVFAQVQKGPNPDYPASLVQPVSGNLRWYVDKEVVYGRSKDSGSEERAPISQRRNGRSGQ